MRRRQWTARNVAAKRVAKGELGRPLPPQQTQDGFLRLVLDHCTDAIVVVDREGIVRFLNPAAEALFDRSSAEMPGSRLGFPVTAEAPQEVDIARSGQERRVIEVRATKAELRGEGLYVVGLRDITELVRLREELRALSLVDELTGLHNRRGFVTLVEQELKTAERTVNEMLLILVHLDALKRINGVFGRDHGDLALVDTANVLKRSFRRCDIIGRLGGDEFAVLGIRAGRPGADVILMRVQENVNAHNISVRRPYQLSLTVGIAVYDPQRPSSIDQLLARADAAMYEQKCARKRLQLGEPGPPCAFAARDRIAVRSAETRGQPLRTQTVEAPSCS